jgi:hypothetical protein
MENLIGINNKRKGGRKPKPDAEKAAFKIGGFWLTRKEKEAYDKKFSASGLNNQTEFFRRILFGGSLKLYYRDIHSEKIYMELLKIEKQIQDIGLSYKQVAEQVHKVSVGAELLSLLERLKLLTLEMENKFIQMLPHFEPFSPQSPLEAEPPANSESSFATEGNRSEENR